MQGLAEQPRILLLSVPYALKAADAQTLDGKPASAFLLASPGSDGSSITNATAARPVAANRLSISGSGTTNFIPLWTSSTTLGNSELFQANGRVGVGTTSPGAKLDVLTGNPIAQRSSSISTGGVGTYGISAATSGTGAGILAEAHSTAGVAAVFNNVAGGKVVSVQGAGIEKLSADAAGNLNLACSINGGLRLLPVKDKFHNTGINVIAGNSLNSIPATAFGATIAGGGGGTEAPNVASDSFATVGGGGSNTASGVAATVGGGAQNKAAGTFSVIAGGGGNSTDVLAGGSTVGGGAGQYRQR